MKPIDSPPDQDIKMEEKILSVQNELENLKSQVAELSNTVRLLKRWYNIKTNNEFIDSLRNRQREIVEKYNQENENLRK